MPIDTEKAAHQRSKLIEIYNYMYAGWCNHLEQAQCDTEFYLDAQNSEKEEKRAKEIGRTLYVFNKIKRQVRMLHGYEQRNRHILKIQGIGPEDENASDQHTGVIMQQMAANGYDIMSEAFRWGPLISGSALFEPYRDRNGNVKFGRMGYNQFLIDPSTSRQDLSDCGFYMTGRYMADGQVKSLLPKSSDKIDNIQPSGMMSTRWTQGTQYPYRIRGKIRLYEELWEKSTKLVDMILHVPTGKMVPFKQIADKAGKENADRIVALMRDPRTGQPLLQKFKQAKDEITLTAYVDSEPVWSGPNPLGIDEFNPVWMIGEYCPENDRSDLKLQGFARTLRDPQKARNRRLNQMIDIVETQISTVRLVRQDAIKNIKSAYRSGQGGPIFIKEDFSGTLEDAFRQIPSPSIPPGMFQLLEVLEREETNCGGLNESVFGNDEGQSKGIAIGLNKVRTGQALVGQEGFFSNFRAAKQQLGKKLVKINQQITPDHKVMRMLNQPIDPSFRDPNFAEYDCIPTEGLLTDTQRITNFEELKILKQMFPEEGRAITLRMMLERAPIQNKKPLYEALDKAEAEMKQQAEKAEKLQMHQMQMQERSQQQMDAIAMSEAKQGHAKMIEDISDAQLNRVETLEKLNELKQTSGRENIRALVEIGQALDVFPSKKETA